MIAPVELPESSPSWFARAECFRRGADLNLFYPNRTSDAPPIIEAFCEHCPVIQDCHDYAEHRDEVGIWGARLRVRRGAVNGVTRVFTRTELERGSANAAPVERDRSPHKCAVCGRAERVRLDGTMRSHHVGRGDRRRRCPGSACLPATAEVAS